jgi:hypothetical protein
MRWLQTTSNMKYNDMLKLGRGDLVAHASSGEIYVVTDNLGRRVTAVRTVDITNPHEWEKVIVPSGLGGSSIPVGLGGSSIPVGPGGSPPEANVWDDTEFLRSDKWKPAGRLISGDGMPKYFDLYPHDVIQAGDERKSWVFGWKPVPPRWVGSKVGTDWKMRRPNLP